MCVYDSPTEQANKGTAVRSFKRSKLGYGIPGHEVGWRTLVQNGAGVFLVHRCPVSGASSIRDAQIMENADIDSSIRTFQKISTNQSDQRLEAQEISHISHRIEAIYI